MAQPNENADVRREGVSFGASGSDDFKIELREVRRASDARHLILICICSFVGINAGVVGATAAIDPTWKLVLLLPLFVIAGCVIGLAAFRLYDFFSLRHRAARYLDSSKRTSLRIREVLMQREPEIDSGPETFNIEDLLDRALADTERNAQSSAMRSNP